MDIHPKYVIVLHSCPQLDRLSCSIDLESRSDSSQLRGAAISSRQLEERNQEGT